MKKIKLGELINSEIIEGKYLSSRFDSKHLYTEEEVDITRVFKSEGKVLYLRPRFLVSKYYDLFLKSKYFIIKVPDTKKERSVANYVGNLHPSWRDLLSRVGDIIIQRSSRPRIFFFNKDDPKCFIGPDWFLVRPENSRYLSEYLEVKSFYKNFLNDLVSIKHEIGFENKISLQDLNEIEIFKMTLKELKDYKIQEERKENKKKELIKSLESGEMDPESIVNNSSSLKKLLKNKTLEKTHLEFKSTLRTDMENKKVPADDLKHSVLKTIGGFCNTEGGDLYIGISDDHKIIGIEKDNFKNQDHFLRTLTQLIQDNIYPNILDLGNVIEIKFEKIENKTVCQITVKPTREHIFVKDNKDLVFYRRNLGKTDPLNGKKLLDYVKVKEGKYNKKPKNL